MTVQGGVVVEASTFNFQKQETEDHIMRFLILAAAATLVITGTAMAAQHHHHHHYRDASASVAEGSAPADALGAHAAHIKNLHDSGYNPAGDFDAAGNLIKQY
jgi:predicted lysophospholipase L1 biosynthesis ABC-type transport system permease subunit